HRLLPAPPHPREVGARRQLTAVAGEPGPVYRASKLSRGAAWLVLACAAGVAVGGLVNRGGVPNTALVMAGIFALFSWALLRLGPEESSAPDERGANRPTRPEAVSEA